MTIVCHHVAVSCYNNRRSCYGNKVSSFGLPIYHANVGYGGSMWKWGSTWTSSGCFPGHRLSTGYFISRGNGGLNK